MTTAIRSAKSIQPLLNRILIQRSKPETVSRIFGSTLPLTQHDSTDDSAEGKTASGLFLPEKSAPKLNEGTVLAVGPGGIDDATGKVVKPSIAIGQRVLLPAFGGTPVTVGEEEFSLFRESEILAIINEQ